GGVFDPSSPVENNPGQLTTAGKTGPIRELRFVFKKRSASGDDGVHGMSQCLHRIARVFRSDPLRFTMSGGDLAVERHGKLENAEWTLVSNGRQKGFVHARGVFFENAGFNGD